MKLLFRKFMLTNDLVIVGNSLMKTIGHAMADASFDITNYSRRPLFSKLAHLKLHVV